MNALGRVSEETDKKKVAIQGCSDEGERQSVSTGSLLHCARVPRVRAKAIRLDINE